MILSTFEYDDWESNTGTWTVVDCLVPGVSTFAAVSPGETVDEYKEALAAALVALVFGRLDRLTWARGFRSLDIYLDGRRVCVAETMPNLAITEAA